MLNLAVVHGFVRERLRTLQSVRWCLKRSFLPLQPEAPVPDLSANGGDGTLQPPLAAMPTETESATAPPPADNEPETAAELSPVAPEPTADGMLDAEHKSPPGISRAVGADVVM